MAYQNIITNNKVYSISDEDSSGVVKYFGFVYQNNILSWIILKQDTTSSPYTYRYANLGNNSTMTSYGAGTTIDPWTNRATLTYNYLFNLIGL